MIRNDISDFLNTKKPKWPPYCSEYVKQSLKKRKYEVTILLLILECILAKPMESSTYLDHQYFIILNLST